MRYLITSSAKFKGVLELSWIHIGFLISVSFILYALWLFVLRTTFTNSLQFFLTLLECRNVLNSFADISFILQRNLNQVKVAQELMDISHIQIQHCAINFTAVMTANIENSLVLQVNRYILEWTVNICAFFNFFHWINLN